MTFLAPAALWFALVGPIVVALYLLKIKKRRESVPSLEFWRQLAPETQVRSLFQRLKRWWSLLLWLAAAACLVLALANPTITSGRMKSETIAVVVDNSASMQTVEPRSGGKTRLELAAQVVAELVGARPVNDEWLLIEAGRRPKVVQGFTRDSRIVRQAALRLTPAPAIANLDGAVILAGQLLEGKPNPRIVIVSDGAAGKVKELAARDQRIVHWPVGDTDDNLGIAGISVRSRSQQAEHHVMVRVVNASAERIETRLVFTVDGAMVKVEPLAIDGGGAWEKVVVLRQPEGGVLLAAIDRDDSLAADNKAYAVLDPIEPATVFLVSSPDEAFYFEQALTAMETLVDAQTSQTLSPQDHRRLGGLRDEADLTIFNNCLPEAWPANGRAIFINRWPSDVPARLRGELSPAHLEIAQVEHPLVRYLSLRPAAIARAAEIELLEGAEVLARDAGGTPLVFLHQQPGRLALCLAFDVLDSDLPFRNGFPILLRNAVAFLATETPPPIQRQYRTGDVIEPLETLPGDVVEVTVGRPGPAGISLETIPAAGGSFWFDQTHEVGPLRFEIGGQTAYTCINLADEQESRTAPDRPKARPEEKLAISRRIAGVVPWLALAAFGALLISLEWFTYHHRWTE